MAMLLGHPHRPIGALELVDLARGSDGMSRVGNPADVRAQVREGDLREGYGSGVGPVLDAQAKAEYRQRLDDLEEAYEVAVRNEDDGRAAKIDEERTFLVNELRIAAGLGGRSRDGKAPKERARTSVQKSITAALRNVEDAHPALARHLKTTIRTGTFCTYVPTDDVHSWTVDR